MLKFLAKSLFVCSIIILMSACNDTANACTYEEAMSADYSGYPLEDVERILREDITQPSTLSVEQKSACLIGDMVEFTDEFDKRCGGIKFEALAAISAVETGYFSSEVSKCYNNVGGMRTTNGYLQYASKSDGIQALSDLLNNQYINPNGAFFEGNTILDIGKHYNQSVHWVNMYVKVRLDMERRVENVEPEWPESEQSNARTVESVSRFEQFFPEFVQYLEHNSRKNKVELGAQTLGSKSLWTTY